MKPLAIIGALIGGAVGFGIWFAVVHLTGYEVGYVAIGVGAVVGLGCRLFGGHSAEEGIATGIIAFLAILGGNYMASSIVLDDLVESSFESFSSEENYEATKEIAVAFHKTKPQEADFGTFMESHGYDFDLNDSLDTSDEVQLFKTYEVPILESMGRGGNDLPFAEFQEKYRPFHKDLLDACNLTPSFLDTIDVKSVIFWVLGVVAAFGVVTKGNES